MSEELPPVRIEAAGLRTLEFVDPTDRKRVVTVTCDALQLAEAFWLVDEAFPIVRDDPRSVEKRTDGMRGCIEQLLNSADNPLPPLTTDQVYQVRMAAYQMAADVKKKLGFAEGPDDQNPKDTGPTSCSTGNSP